MPVTRHPNGSVVGKAAKLLPLRNRRTSIQRSSVVMFSMLMLSLIMMMASQVLARLPVQYEVAIAQNTQKFGSSELFQSVKLAMEKATHVAEVLDSEEEVIPEVAIQHLEQLNKLQQEQSQQTVEPQKREQVTFAMLQVEPVVEEPLRTTVILTEKAEQALSYLAPPFLQPIEPSFEAQAVVKKYFGKDVDLTSSRFSRYDKYFQKYSSLYFGAEVDWRWFKAQAYVESGMRIRAESHKGAQGIMQIMPGTWKEIQRLNGFFRDKSPDQPEWNIAGGIYYNAYLRRIWRSKVDRSEHFKLMFASYNAGVGRVTRLTTDEDNFYYFAHHRLPRETRRYLQKISALMDRYTGTRLDGIDLA